MSKNAPFFSSLIERGQFRVDDKGHARLFGEFVLFVPPRVILKMQDDLEGRIGREDMKEFISDMGGFQVRQGMERYREKYNWDEIPRENLLEYINKLAKLMGWGEVDIDSLDVEEGTFEIRILHPTLPSVYRREEDEMADEPICHYIRGMMEQAMNALMDCEVECQETQCAAVEGDVCRLEGSPIN